MNSCLENQKQEMKFLKELFSSGDKLFRITSASLDEMDCLFVVNQEQMLRLHVDFPSSYPLNPPLWSLEKENEVIQKILDLLFLSQGIENRILNQVKTLIEKVCFHFSLPLPKPEMVQLESYFNNQQSEPSSSNQIASTSKQNKSSISQQTLENDEELESDNDDDENLEIPDIDDHLIDEEESPPNDMVAKADKIRLKTETEENNNSSSVRDTSSNATLRIMQEIKALTVGAAIKNESIKFDLVKESLYEWEVKLMAKAFDSDSQFYKDLIKLEKKFVLLSVEFNAKFPFDPPFIRVIEPVIVNGHIESGGALCMEVVMHRGWSPAYSMESLFLQIATTIVRGKGRVDFESMTPYNRALALSKFRWLERYYDPKTGHAWHLDKTG